MRKNYFIGMNEFESFRGVITDMERDLGIHMDAFWRSAEKRFRPSSLNTFDFKEQDEHYVMEFFLPRSERDEIRVEVGRGMMRIYGHQKAMIEEQGYPYDGWEEFERIINIPEDASEEKIEAIYDDETLTVIMEKTQLPKLKKIKVIKPSKSKLLDHLSPTDDRPLLKDKIAHRAS